MDPPSVVPFGELKQFLNYHPLVEILLPDEFVAKANAGLL